MTSLRWSSASAWIVSDLADLFTYRQYSHRKNFKKIPIARMEYRATSTSRRGRRPCRPSLRSTMENWMTADATESTMRPGTDLIEAELTFDGSHAHDERTGDDGQGLQSRAADGVVGRVLHDVLLRVGEHRLRQ